MGSKPIWHAGVQAFAFLRHLEHNTKLETNSYIKRLLGICDIVGIVKGIYGNGMYIFSEPVYRHKNIRFLLIFLKYI